MFDRVGLIQPELFNHFFFFFTKLGTVVQHHEPECDAQKLVHCLQCQGHSEGLDSQDMTISTLSSKLLVGLQPDLV